MIELWRSARPFGLTGPCRAAAEIRRGPSADRTCAGVAVSRRIGAALPWHTGAAAAYPLRTLRQMILAASPARHSGAGIVAGSATASPGGVGLLP